MAYVAAVSRAKNQLDIFAIGTDGKMYTAAWNPTQSDGWHGWWCLGDTKFPYHAAVTAISQLGDLYVLAVDESGRICGNRWTDTWSGWHQIQGGTAPPGAYLGTCAWSPNSFDLFVCGSDSKVATITFRQRNPHGPTKWLSWHQILPGSLDVVPGSPITAACRRPGCQDLFVTDKDGRTMGAWRADTGDWNGPNHIQGGIVQPGAPISVTVRSQDQYDLFVVNKEGKVCSAAWHTSYTEGWRGWWELLTDVKFPSGGWVTAVSRSQDKLDIFAIDKTGRCMTAAWPTDSGWAGWWQTAGALGFGGKPLNVCVRDTDLMDGFFVGLDHQVWSVYWSPNLKGGFEGNFNVLNFSTIAPPKRNYKFSIPSMDIHEILSRNNDTLHISLSVAVAGREPQKYYRFLGDQQPGGHRLGDAVCMEVADDEYAVFSYVLVNNGHENRPAVERKLREATEFLAKKGADAAAGAAASAVGGLVGAAIGASVGSAIVPVIGSALGALLGWLITEGIPIIFQDCDGPVGSGVHVFKGEDLRKTLESGGKVNGTDRAQNHEKEGFLKCGCASDYSINYNVGFA